MAKVARLHKFSPAYLLMYFHFFCFYFHYYGRSPLPDHLVDFKYDKVRPRFQVSFSEFKARVPLAAHGGVVLYGALVSK